MKDKVFQYYLDLYKSGATQEYLNYSLELQGLSFDDLIAEIKKRYITPSNRLTEDMKIIIARRDDAEISRKAIGEELGLNSRTVQRACQTYGTPMKYNDNSSNFDEVCEKTKYKVQKDEQNRLICPISNKPCKEIPSEISSEAYYSIDSGEEWHVKDNKLYRVKWEEM